ncbi:hypothetical protein RclHR1_01210015 [Rhizophagus clarus]|uniref:Uncharacterized protein n=1 Tax=Rhizophagus clarus TaxID=94130 RepID=A0A2Z6Q678_9GLOM|nr:hypothetical protein RclHR1_01210015 [Rhizophagus clarus]
MAFYYSSWYKQKVNSGSEGVLTSASTDTLLTPAQVTVSSVRDKLVYNIEYKQNIEKPVRKPSERRVASSSSSTFADANVVTAKFHQRNHSRRHTRKSSSESQSSLLSNLSALSDISTDCMWDDWIVKYLDKKDVAVDDAQIEDWIFETM